jgi:transcriptional regulator with XRE-family HTH domain
MVAKGVSQASVARLTGVQQSTLSRVFRGADGRRLYFTPEQAKRLRPIAKALGVRMTALVLPRDLPIN